MHHIWGDRRTFIAVLTLLLVFGLGIYRGLDVSMSLVMVCGFIAASNATEKIMQSQSENKNKARIEVAKAKASVVSESPSIVVSTEEKASQEGELSSTTPNIVRELP
jgi:small neutral amino acid transporter SnatA (MarC family)